MPTRYPATNTKSSAKEVVNSRGCAVRKWRTSKAAINSSTPEKATQASAVGRCALSMPSTETNAKLRKPKSLLAHSRSTPTSIRMHSEAASCTATIGVGMRKASGYGSCNKIVAVYDWRVEGARENFAEFSQCLRAVRASQCDGK